MLQVHSLAFAYDSGKPVFKELNFDIPDGARVLLVGENGSGKSTLLKLMAGVNAVPPEMIHYKNKSPFNHRDTKDSVLVETDLTVYEDLTVADFLKTPGDLFRQHELMDIFKIDPHWQLNQLSTGERRKFQILLSLRQPATLFLLDEATSNLDIVMRKRLLNWLKKDSLARGTTIVYATHILDDLVRGHFGREHDWDYWPTHILYLKPKHGLTLREYYFAPISEIEGLRHTSLLEWCEQWME